MDAGSADFDKTQRRMEGIRSGIWRNGVDLADDAIVSARRWCDHDAVDIHKPRIACAEPDEIRAVVLRVLIEREQEGVQLADPPCEECFTDQVFEPFCL